MEIVIVIIVAVLAAALIAAPLRAGRTRRVEAAEAAERAELEAVKEAKLGEIRDTELDLRLGKLSEEDWRALDGELREEAVAILRRLDALGSAAEEEPTRVDSSRGE